METRSKSKDLSENRFICRTHGKPIQHVNFRTDRNEKNKFKLFCEECLNEINKMKFRKGDSVAGFLSQDNYHIFDESIIQFKEQTQQKIRNLKTYSASLETAFDEFIETIREKRQQIKDMIRKEMDTQSDLFTQAQSNYKKYQKNFQDMLSGSTDERLLNETVDLYAEIDRAINPHSTPKGEAPEFKRIGEIYTNCSNIIARSKKSLDELFNQSNQNSVVMSESKRLTLRPMASIPRDTSPGSYRYMPSPNRANTSRNDSQDLTNRESASPNKSFRTRKFLTSLQRPSASQTRDTTNTHPGNSTPTRFSQAINSNTNELSPMSSVDNSSPTPGSNLLNGASPRDNFRIYRRNTDRKKTEASLSGSPTRKGTEVVFDDEELKSGNQLIDTAISSHMLETKMKYVEAMIYLSNRQLLVYGGSMRGEQHSSLVFHKMDSTPKVLKTVSAHSLTITALAYLGKKLFSCSKDCQVKLWDLQEFVPLVVLKHKSAVLGITLHEKRNIAFTYGFFQDIRCWDLKDLSDWFINLNKNNHITQLHFIESKEWLVAANSQAGAISIIDFKSGDTLFDLPGQSSGGYDDMEFDAEKNRLLTVGSDGVVKIWNFETNEPVLERTICFKYRGGYNSTNSLVVDFKDDMLFLTNSRNNFWMGKISEGMMIGFLNWMEVGVTNIQKIIFIKRKQWILAANKNNGKIAIVNVKEIKKLTGDAEAGPKD